MDLKTLKKRIISDMRVELSEEFDRNFQRKAFFTKKWAKRKDPNALGSTLVVTGALRRSIQCEETADGVRFTSQVPYASVHNEGGTGSVTVRQHKRKSKKGKRYTVRQHMRRMEIPQRQFIGDGAETQRLIKGVIDDNMQEFVRQLNNYLEP